MLAELVVGDGWLRWVLGGVLFILWAALMAALTWLNNNQRKTNDRLAETALTNERVAGVVTSLSAMIDAHAARIERLERWQDTDRYAEVIEQRREARR